MAVRPSMAALIASMRILVGDVTAPQDFADQDVQDAYDGYRETVRYELLSPAPDIQPGQSGATTANFVWATYFSQYGDWEDDVVLQGLNVNTGQAWVLLTPVSSEPIVGKWTFAVTLPAIATPPAQYPPVWATGKVYDRYAVAASLLERKIALRALTTFSFSIGGASAQVAQMLDRLERLAKSYWAKSWTHSVTIRRDDLASDSGGSGQGGNRTDSASDLLPSVLAPTVSGTAEG